MKVRDLGFVKGVVFLVLLSVLIYGQTLSFEFVVYDDQVFVFHPGTRGWWDAPLIGKLTTPHIGYPIPLVIGIYSSLIAMWEVTPFPFHLLNLTIHLLNVVLAFHACRSISGATLPALFATCLWALHPLLVEPISWATGTKDLLALAGALVALSGVNSYVRGRTHLGLVAVIVGFLVGVAAKPTAVTIGAWVLTASVVFYLTERARTKPLGVLAASLTVLGVIYSFFVSATHTAYGGHVDGSRFLRMVAALNLQLQNLLVPLSLGPKYTYVVPGWLDILVALGGVGGALAIGYYAVKHKMPWVALGLVWLAIHYLPVSNVLPLTRFTADSYVYVPLIGVSLMVAGLLRDHEIPRVGHFLTAIILSCFLVISCFQTHHWNNAITLWERARITAHPSEQTYVGMKLGQAYFMYGRWEDAVKAFESGDTNLYGQSLPFDGRWPSAYWKLGKVEEAERLFEKGRELNTKLTSDPRILADQRDFERFYVEFLKERSRRSP